MYLVYFIDYWYFTMYGSHGSRSHVAWMAVYEHACLAGIIEPIL